MRKFYILFAPNFTHNYFFFFFCLYRILDGGQTKTKMLPTTKIIPLKNNKFVIHIIDYCIVQSIIKKQKKIIQFYHICHIMIVKDSCVLTIQYIMIINC